MESQKRERIGLQVERGLRVDVFVACLRDCSEAPLHVPHVEVELCFGDVVVVLLDGPGIIGALLVGGGLGEGRCGGRRRSDSHCALSLHHASASLLKRPVHSTAMMVILLRGSISQGYSVALLASLKFRKPSFLRKSFGGTFVPSVSVNTLVS